MSASDVFEIVTSIAFLILGVWASLFAYGWAGERLFGGYRWNAGFRRQLRWLGPMLAFSSVAGLVLTLRYAQ